MTKVLLIEDAEEYQKIVLRTLPHLHVLCANDADEAIALVSKNDFDLILLDIHLPQRDGYSLLAEFQSKEETKDIPVICLTGKAGVTDKVTAFSLGAEDYLVKPFDPLELRARVDARLSRTKKTAVSETSLVVGPLEIDRSRHRTFLQEEQGRREVELTQTEFKILCCLAKRPDQIFTRDQLLVSVWGEDAKVLDRVVDTHICSLRKKLGRNSPTIKSVPGIGYKLLPVEKKASRSVA